MSTSHPGQLPGLVAAELPAAKALDLEPDTSSGELTPEAEAAIEAAAS